MMNSALDTKQKISDCLNKFSNGSLLHNATELLHVLGYESDKTVLLSPNTVAEFQDNFGDLHSEKAITEDWKSVDMIFQLTDDEIAMAGRSQPGLFASENWMDKGIIKSFIFLAIELSADKYSRTQLATITREINKLFPMPAIILFRHGLTLTLSVIDRREHKRDRNLDVLEKVTLIKDIRIDNPHRAHIEILFDLSIEHLKSTFAIATFDELYNAWRKTLSASELNKRFYQELSNWYFWALREVDFPAQAGISDKENRATNVIRLITRLIFAWFMKEKSLLPEELFNEQKLRDNILKSLAPDESTFYQAILQNLFFATLNTEMDNATRPRKFRGEGAGNSRDQNYMVHSVYRHKTDFRNADDALQLFATIPFLNGGLFECLDKRIKRDDKEVEVRIDGFSDKPQKTSSAPNRLFFSEDHDIDLNEELGTKNKKYKVRGLIDILHSYKFTVDENTPIEEEIALDPELLGKVFENLLASYNPETGVAARKQTGSFYTPREIVGYMVDESLLAYFQNYLETAKVLSDKSAKTLPENLRHLLAYNEEAPRFTDTETTALIKAASEVKILDPACGSGAFPMGILHKLVFVLSKLDPGNIGWKEQQLARAERDLQRAHSMEDEEIRAKAVEEAKHRINEIRDSFDNPNHEIDYLRKLYLIEHCIYGVDIQPIAMQISKLRFFISLVIDQTINNKEENRGIRPLPNLETKLVAANTLMAIEKPVSGKQFTLRNPEIDRKEAELKIVRERYFLARTPKTKLKYREEDKRLRDELGALLLADGFLPETTEKLAHWDPYDQKASAEFFDAEWMFGVTDGFDIVIGNPPYVRIQNIDSNEAKILKANYLTATGKFDIYVLFVEQSFKFLKSTGVICFIHPHRFLTADYGKGLQRFLDEKRGLAKAVCFGVDQIFETATTYTGIFLYSSGNEFFDYKSVASVDFRELPFLRKNYTSNGTHWTVGESAGGASELIQRMMGYERKLTDVFAGIFQGIVTVGDDIFVIPGKIQGKYFYGTSQSTGSSVQIEADLMRPLLKGENIRRYMQPQSNLLIFYPHIQSELGKTIPIEEVQLKKDFPYAYSYISQFKQRLVEKKIKYKTNPKYWYTLHRAREMRLFLQEKILTPQLQNQPHFCIDSDAWFPDAGGYTLVKKITSEEDYKFLLGVLNSLLLWFFIKNTSNAYNNNYFYFKTKYLEPFSIPAATPAEQDVIATKVDQILTAKAADPAADTFAIEREIDILVADLYGLDKEERKLVGIE